MTATARAMSMGARSIVTGHQIISQCDGSTSNLNRIATHVGPNALLRTSTYPNVSGTTSSLQGMNGPLFVPAAPTPPGSDSWRIDGTTENAGFANGLCTQWPGGTSQAYVYNNLPSNTGGTVPTGGLVIDGFPVPAGTLVFQFMDFSFGSIGLIVISPGPNVVFRGCRARSNFGANGFCNNDFDVAQKQWFLYCDIGGNGPNATTQEAQVAIESTGTGLVYYRNYISYIDSGIQPKASDTWIDIFENYVEKITALGSNHLNGICFNGGEICSRMQRNYIVEARYDENGVQVSDTDCIAFFDDSGGPDFYPGTGTNPDGTLGYQIIGNYIGGTGYCAYTAAIGYNPANSNWANNLLTTSSYPVGDTSAGASGNGGGFHGPLYTGAQPSWGSNGNTKSNNLWADGPDARTTFI